jgi:membrane protein
VGALTAIVAWPQSLAWIGLDSGTAALVSVVKWVIVLVALLTSFALAYYFGPDVKQEWEWITPGSTFGVLVLILASLGMRSYFQYGSNSSETYGVLAGTVLILLWLYIAALALLIGAEINCVIEHAAPAGREPGQKVAPQRVRAQEPTASTK